MLTLRLDATTVLYGAAGLFAVTYVMSELLYQRNSTRGFREGVKAVRAKEAAQVEEGLSSLLRLIEEDRGNDLGAKGIVIDSGLSAVVQVLTGKDCLAALPRSTVSLALKLMAKCADEASGRTAAARAGAIPALLRLLADMSHVRTDSPGDNKLMEDIAITLMAVTNVDGSKIILPGDIPPGSEGAERLLRSKNLDKILDMVCFDSRSTTYVQTMVKCFASISHLEEGVVRLRQAGAVPRMVALLQKPVLDIKENALLVLRNMIKQDAGARSQFFEVGPGDILLPFLLPQYHKQPKIMMHALHLFGDLLFRGTPAETKAFEEKLIELDAFEPLSAGLGKDIPKAVRDLMEEVLRIALEANVKKGETVELDDKPWISTKLREHAPAIARRRKVDQEEARMKAQEMQKQRQMMQMMAMQQMMGGDGGMEEMMAAMGMDAE